MRLEVLKHDQFQNVLKPLVKTSPITMSRTVLTEKYLDISVFYKE